jgi:hypothetical protein
MRAWINIIAESQEELEEVSRVRPLDPEDEASQNSRLWRVFSQFSPTKVGPLIGHYEFWTAKTPSGNLMAFAVEVDEDGDAFPVAYLDLDHEEGNRYIVHMVYTESDARGQSLAYSLYLGLLRQGTVIISDGEQTPGGQGIWSKLASDHRVRVTRIDVDGGEEDEVDDPSDYYDDGETSFFKAVWVR